MTHVDVTDVDVTYVVSGFSRTRTCDNLGAIVIVQAVASLPGRSESCV